MLAGAADDIFGKKGAARPGPGGLRALAQTRWCNRIKRYSQTTSAQTRLGESSARNWQDRPRARIFPPRAAAPTNGSPANEQSQAMANAAGSVAKPLGRARPDPTQWRHGSGL